MLAPTFALTAPISGARPRMSPAKLYPNWRMTKHEKEPLLGALCPDRAGGGVCAGVFDAHGADHHQLLYDPVGDQRQLRQGVLQCLRQRGQDLHLRDREPEVHPRQGQPQPVHHRAHQEPGLSAEILELRDPGGAHCAAPAGGGLHHRLRLHPLAGEGALVPLFLLRDIDAHAGAGDAGAQLSGQRLAEPSQHPVVHHLPRGLRPLLRVPADQVHAPHPRLPH